MVCCVSGDGIFLLDRICNDEDGLTKRIMLKKLAEYDTENSVMRCRRILYGTGSAMAFLVLLLD
jgi:hypothetical protein